MPATNTALSIATVATHTALSVATVATNTALSIATVATNTATTVATVATNKANLFYIPQQIQNFYKIYKYFFGLNGNSLQ